MGLTVSLEGCKDPRKDFNPAYERPLKSPEISVKFEQLDSKSSSETFSFPTTEISFQDK